MKAAWTRDERERRDQVLAGETVVANVKTDLRLVEWAQENGLYVFIGRPGKWGNPFVLDKDGDRPVCIASFRVYFALKHGLHDELDELRGKVLGCYCHPETCHGHELVKFIKERPK